MTVQGTRREEGGDGMRGWWGVAVVCGLAVGGATATGPASAQGQPIRGVTRPRCGALLPRNSFPGGMTGWTSQPTAPNRGAIASGLQLARYRWGYVIVTPDVYASVRTAQRHYALQKELLHGGRRVTLRPIGQATVAWITRDGVVGDTVTTILLRAGRAVALVNVGAARPALAVATRLARALAAHGCR